MGNCRERLWNFLEFLEFCGYSRFDFFFHFSVQLFSFSFHYDFRLEFLSKIGVIVCLFQTNILIRSLIS